MDLEVFWTHFAKRELRQIFDYHKEKASLTRGNAKNSRTEKLSVNFVKIFVPFVVKKPSSLTTENTKQTQRTQRIAAPKNLREPCVNLRMLCGKTLTPLKPHPDTPFRLVLP